MLNPLGNFEAAIDHLEREGASRETIEMIDEALSELAGYGRLGLVCPTEGERHSRRLWELRERFCDAMLGMAG
jgi:hypothetical protein